MQSGVKRAALSVACVFACAFVFAGRAHGAKPVRTLSADAMPEGFVAGTAQQPLVLHLRKVGDDFVATSDDGDAAISAQASSMDRGAMLRLSSSATVNLKVDLYISPDGKRYFYTSSCPLMGAISGMEMWPHPVHSYAFGNVHAVPDGRMDCR